MFLIRLVSILHGIISIFLTHRKTRKNKMSKDAFGLYLRHKLESLGPSFIKIGQILSLRPDLIPLEYCMQLRGLLDKTEEVPLHIILGIIREEIGDEPSKVFSHIGKRPLGTASLAQVHKAKLVESGEVVALKVRKPGVKKLIKTDINVLKFLNAIFYKRINKYINSDALIDDLHTIFEKELNFIKEGSNIERFQDMFDTLRYVKTPKVYWKHTSEKLLVMEFIPGVPLNKIFNDIDKSKKLRNAEEVTVDGITFEKKKLAKKLIHVTAVSVFKYGFFHADPHPANIILTYDNRIAYIDFGMVGDLLNTEKIMFREIVYCIVMKDEEKILNSLMMYNRSLGLPLPDQATLQGLKHFMHDLISEFVASDQNNFPISKLLYSLGDMTFKFHFPPPQFIMLIAKQIFTLEGLALYLIPDLNVINEFKPYVTSYKAQDSFNKLKNEQFMKFLDDSLTLGLMLPESISAIINNVKEEGMFKIPVKTGKNLRLILLILLIYGTLMALALIQYLHTNINLILILIVSIITEIVVLFLSFNKEKK